MDFYLLVKDIVLNEIVLLFFDISLKIKTN